MKRKVFSLLVLCLFAFLGLANAQSSGTVSANPDPIDLGYRPLGAWMRPFQVQLTATGAAQTITAIEADKDFFVIDANLPSTVSATAPFNFTVDHGEAAEGPVKGNLVAMTESRKAYIFDIQAVAYSPIAADVTETAPTITLPFTATVGENIYDNYLLPGDLADGKDVVYKMNITDDILFNAYVEGENGKVALYQEDFAGEPGPGATNNYTGINVGGGGGGPFEAQVGFGTNTSGYVPAYYLYNYSISQQLFLADELTLAGAAAGNINSISFYTESTYGYLMKNTSIYIGNTTAATVTDQSPSIANMTLVYSGNYQQVVGWNEFEFSTPFAWDGTSNVLVLFIMNNGNWSSSIAWQTHNPGFMASAYQYRDGDPFDPATPVSMYTSSTLRANTIFKGVARSASPMNVNITDMTLTPGVYYLAASSTSDEFTVNVNTDELPVPEPAYNPYPADGDVDITTPVTLTWNFGNYTTAYRLLLGTTYPPTEVVVDWTNELANGYYTGELINNKNYFWRVDEKNTNGITEGEVWGFTTTLNIPTGLAAVDEKIYVGDDLQLYWDQVEDRSYRGYNVYQDGVKINTELVTTTEYTVSGLTYNTDAGYVFNVTAVYDEGESNFSSDLIAFVSGNGTISGKVTEVDGTTGIAGADIVFEGLDEFLRPATYTFTTGANGTYTGAMKKGTYNGIAMKEGYQGAEYEGEVTINYNTTTPNINFILKEIWYPLGEVIAEEVDENQVKVYWSANIMSEIIESFETGDFSAFDWVNDAAHPWVITTTNPYDGEYCVRSGNQDVNSSSSVLQVSVEINRDGLMSFYGKASSEQNWDYGYFYIDGTQKASFTGAGNWVKKEYPITAGVHTFKWEYTKDGSLSANDDCLYIDYISFIHDAEPVVPDGPGTWYYYDNGVNEDAIGTGGGNFSWAVMFPAGSYTGTAVTKVSAFDYMAMDGTVTIYNDGATAPASPVGTRDVSFEGSEDFVEFPFSSPVAIDASKNLWVVFYNGSGATYPAAVCTNTGDANGRWVSIDGVVWEDMATYSLDYTFMIRAFVSTGAKGEVQEITLNNQPHTGGTLAAAGVAKANNTRAFDHYNIYRTTCDDMTGENAEFLGSINDTIYLDNDWASLEPGVYKWGVSKFYQGNRSNRVVYDFESNLSGWTTIDANNDGITWCDLPGINNYTSYYVGMTLDWYHGGSNAAISGSYINGIGALNPDEYLVSPQTSISNGTTISFWTAACDPSYAADHFGVFVSTGSATNPSDFVSVQEWTLTGKSSRAGKSPASREGRGDRIGTWYNYTVDLSAYAGQNVYIAFRHFNCYDQYIMCIDDVTINAEGGDTPVDPPVNPTETIAWDFESNLSGWSTIDANNDGYTWCDLPGINNYTDYYVGMTLDWYHGGSNAAISGSYINGIGALSPDDYLVSPQVTIGNGATFSFWTAACDPSYPADHFGVFVSTGSATNPADFVSVQEWTLTGKSTRAGKAPASRDGKGNRIGTWYHYSVDLSAYAGQQAYIAFRHFNCYDQYIMCIDDAELTGSGDPVPPTPGANVRGVEIFRDGVWIAEVAAPAQTYTDINPGEVDEYEIRVVYNGNMEDYSHYTMSCPQVCVPEVNECLAPENLTGSYEYFNNEYFGAMINWNYSGEVNAGWYQYDDGAYGTSVGAGAAFKWAVMFPAGSYTGTSVTKVSTMDMLSSGVMNGSVTIYSGGANAPQTELASMPIQFTGTGEDVEYVFAEPVAIDPTQNLWVVFSNDDNTGYPATASADITGDPNGRWVSLGSWTDLASAGLPGYCWLIHTYITDGIAFNVYRNNELIATVPYSGEVNTYFDEVAIGNYQYQVTAVTGDCESDFALTPDLSQNYVEIAVTSVAEVTDTRIYPNPTTGNVTIEAAGMNHITVVNTLGQVLYDANVNGDQMTMNLGQFKAGVYMLRITTEEGVSVSRVTVTK